MMMKEITINQGKYLELIMHKENAESKAFEWESKIDSMIVKIEERLEMNTIGKKEWNENMSRSIKESGFYSQSSQNAIKRHMVYKGKVDEGKALLDLIKMVKDENDVH